MIRRRQSVLFFTPDYHCSFFLRDELRRRGWRADIFVPSTYPEQFLYDSSDVIREHNQLDPSLRVTNLLRLLVAQVKRVALQLRYKFILHYGSIGQTVARTTLMQRLLHVGLRLSFATIRLFGSKVVYLPAGCRNERPRSDWEQIDDGNVCGNCGYADRCDDKVNHANFDLVRKVTDLRIGWDPHVTQEYEQTFFRYKSIDLNVFHPGIRVPSRLVIKKESPDSIIVLHSFVMKERNWNGRNIKGSSYVLSAVERLKQEGFPIQLVTPTEISSRDMRFVQVQADIVVDQLIYGTWGSTSLEAMALGRPVICYIRQEWQQFLANKFPECREMPVISSTPDLLVDVLRLLVSDSKLRKAHGEKSRVFAEQFLDVRKNCSELIQHLEVL